MQITTRLLSAALVAGVVAACTNTRATVDESDAGGPGPAPGLDEIGEARVTGIEDAVIRLENGEWQGEPFVAGGASRPRVGLVRDFRLTGDLDADGDDESVVLLWSSGGGSGTFEYVAAFAREGDRIVNVATAPLGDRVQVRGGRIEDGRIVLDVVQAGDDDAACCPTELATRTWSLGDGRLGESPAEITGTLSLESLEGGWRLLRLTLDGDPVEAAVTLRLEGERLGGQSACNRYFATVATGEAAGMLTVGRVGATRMYCGEAAMALEDAYLAALAGVRRYGFLAGRLALDWASDDTSGTMLFERAPATDE